MKEIVPTPISNSCPTTASVTLPPAIMFGLCTSKSNKFVVTPTFDLAITVALLSVKVNCSPFVVTTALPANCNVPVWIPNSLEDNIISASAEIKTLPVWTETLDPVTNTISSNLNATLPVSVLIKLVVTGIVMPSDKSTVHTWTCVAEPTTLTIWDIAMETAPEFYCNCKLASGTIVP